MKTNELHESLNELLEHPSGEWLMEELWNPNSPVRRLLMCNEGGLFYSIGDILKEEVKGLTNIRIPFFLVIGHHSNDPPPSSFLSEPDETDNEENGEDEEGFLGFDDEVALLIAANIIRVIRDNPSLKKLINTDDFDYDMLLRETKGLKNINTDVIAEELSPLGQDPDEFSLEKMPEDNRVVYEIKKLIREYVDMAVSDELGIGRLITKIASYIGHLYGLGFNYQSVYLDRIGLTRDEYQSAIRTLLDKDLVENYGSGLVCPNCRPEQTLSFGTESSFAPHEIEIQCSECDTRMDWCLFVRTSDILRNAIRYRDGLLAIAVGWYLSKEGIKFVSNLPTSDGESDLLMQLDGLTCVVEFKMFKRSSDIKDERDFKKAIDQVARAREHLEKSYSMIVHNSDSTSPMMVMDSTSNFDIEILPYLEIGDFLSKLEKTS